MPNQSMVTKSFTSSRFSRPPTHTYTPITSGLHADCVWGKKVSRSSRLLIDNVSLHCGQYICHRHKALKSHCSRCETERTQDFQRFNHERNQKDTLLGQWSLGHWVLWSHLEALKMINNKLPAPWAPENHHQKAEFEGIVTKFFKLTEIFESL